MHIIHLKNITVNYAGREVFSELSWTISSRDRLGLVGPNGAGKSTILKVLMGDVIPDEGTVNIQSGISVGYLQQDVNLPQGENLLAVAMIHPPKLAAVEAEITRLENLLGEPEVYESEARLSDVMEQMETATIEYDKLGGNKHHARVKSILERLGFDESQYDLPIEALSGGQKKLVAVARLALEQPDVLLLDEPDNHLDVRSKSYLEAFMRSYNGAVVIVSHDRYLLDEVVTGIVELENSKLTVYTGNYTAYAEEKELAKLRQEQLFTVQQKQVNKLKEQIAWFEELAHRTGSEKHARKARHRHKMLDRLEDSGDLVDRVFEQRTMNLQFEGWRGSTKALELKRVSMAFDDDPLFFDLDLLVRHGERVGLIGRNGAGKSVLFRLILGQLQPVDGIINIGPSTHVGYYSQEHQTLDKWLNKTPLDLIRHMKPMPEGAAVTQLLKFAFVYDQVRQPIGTLSGGERSRLQFLSLMLSQPNLLLLDEPTNNLDIASVEVLEDALESFDGAVLAISHDRYFLERMADRVVELNNGDLVEHLGGYAEYMAQM